MAGRDARAPGVAPPYFDLQIGITASFTRAGIVHKVEARADFGVNADFVVRLYGQERA